MVAPLINLKKKTLSKLDPLWQNFLDPRMYELYGIDLWIVFCIYKFILFYVAATGQIPKSGKDSAGSLEGDWRSQVMSWSAPLKCKQS